MNHRAQLLDEATEWHLRLQGEDVDDDTLSRWVQWCESHPDKQRAFDEIRAFWQLTDALEPAVRDGEFIDLQPAPARVRRRRRAALFAGAAAAGAALWLGWGLWMASDDDAVLTASEDMYETRLPDGSGVQLAARSTVAVNYTADNRSLELKSGEAFFMVAPRPDRPFVVTVGDIHIRALGTAFNVRRAGPRTVVTVTEGVIEAVRDSAGEGDARARAHAGQQLTFVDHEAAPVIGAGAAEAALAWREGRLEYVAEPLEAVIADLNRYTQRPAVVADDAAKALRFSGTVLTGATAEWIAALPGILPITVQNENGVDVIRSLRP